MADELWLIHEKIGKQPWKLMVYCSKFYGKDSATKYAKYMTEQYQRRKYRAVQYVPKKRGIK